MKKKSINNFSKTYQKPKLLKLGSLTEKTKGQGQTGGDWHSKRNTDSKFN